MDEPISFESVKEKEKETSPTIRLRNELQLQSQKCVEGVKSDRKTSGCKWNYRRYSPYENCFKTITDLELTPLFHKKYSIHRFIDPLTKKVKSADPLSILSKKNSEREVRYLILDDLLAEFVNKNDLCLRMEETLKIQNLPTSIPDYVIYTKTNEILGCVEAKKTGKVDENALVQCKLQLISLHTKAKNSLFGTLTDGYSFKFMTLDANGTFHVEKETTIRIFENWDAFDETLGVINRLIHDGVKEVCCIRELRQKLEQQKQARQELQSDIHGLKEEMKGATKEEKKSLKKQIVELKAKRNSLIIRAITSCQWAVEMFIKKYFPSAYKLSLIEDPVTNEVWQRVSENLTELTGIRGIPEAPMCYTRGSYYNYTEETVSEFVKALICPLLTSKQMQMQTFKMINIPGLPTSVCDMTIMDTDGTPVGAVVITAPGKQIQNSMVQCALQLVAIHALHIKRNLFGIITDYRTFVFIIRIQNGVFLIEPRAHKWQTLDELRKICGFLNRLLNIVKQ